MEKIVIIGASGHAKVIIDLVEKEGRYAIAGLLDMSRKPGDTVLGYPILGPEESLLDWQEPLGIVGGIIAIGDNWIRKKVVDKMRKLQANFRFVTAIHPDASIGKEASFGEGTVVMAGAVVNPASKIGNFCILNTRCSLDHDSAMGDFASLAPGVTAGGNVSIGAYSAISLGANIIHGVSIGSHSVIGAGATVLQDMPDYTVAYGVPAVVVRERQKGEKYL
jgi:sugar O-acyltransferase (sialic acid O-acetyltransferase NeuD family)